ncbi:hypothetical protein QFC19_000458 [Naganishia cerealis]|uniref:Uncharacterized protein n=1 Tax=Naganishia cerealis TaxID=610337 RepID=A0ACC2WN60_9TREE|nr:hypothetical protein QFC19_000458 [Naganishia cerealis]
MGLRQTGALREDITFEQFLSVFTAKRQGENDVGLDDGETTLGSSSDALLINKPPRELHGVVQTLVLLCDFSDQPHDSNHSTSYYNALLFSTDSFPSGSMRDYYRRVSGFNNTDSSNSGIDIQGAVHGWFRLPQPMSYYAGGTSGRGAFPANAQGLARDAVKAALDAGVDFTPSKEPSRYDAYREDKITALSSSTLVQGQNIRRHRIIYGVSNG